MSMGIGETFTVFYNKFDKKQMVLFISTSLFYPIAILLFVSILISFFHEAITKLTGLSISLLYSICILTFFNFFSDFMFAIFRNKDKSVYYGLFGLIKTVFELLIAIYLIKYCSQGFEGRISSIFIASTFSFIFVVFYLLKHRLIKLDFSKKWFFIILKRGLPTIPLFFMIFALGNTDKYVINYHYGSARAGVYGLATQFAMLLNVLTTSFIAPFYPFLYKNMYEKNYIKLIKIMFFFIVFLIIVVFSIAFFVPIFFNLFISNKFQESSSYLLLLLIGQFFFSLYLLQAGLIYFKNQNYIYYILSPIIILVTIFINYIFLVKCSFKQLAYSSCLSYFFCFFVVSLFCYKDIIKVFKLIVFQLKLKLNR